MTKPSSGRRVTFLRALIVCLILLAGYLEYLHRRRAPVTVGQCESDAPNALRVLFVGNSHTFRNDLPALFCSLALLAGPTRVHSVTAPGWSLGDHVKAGAAERAITAERWDFVVLQEQGILPTLAPTDFELNFRHLAAIAAAHGARAVVYETAPMLDLRQDGRALHNEFVSISRETGVLRVPVAPAWQRAHDRHPKLQFFDSDSHHPSLLGSAFAAQIFYASLLARSPEGLTAMPGLDAETNQDLQQIAWLEAQAARSPAPSRQDLSAAH